MTVPLGHHDLMEGLPERGCVVCRLVLRAVESQLDGLLYEYVNTEQVHQGFRNGRGLCNRHMWQLPDFRGMSLGVSILDATVLDELLKLTATADVTPSSGLNLFRRGPAASALEVADTLEPSGPCLACQHAEQVEQRTLRTFAEYFSDFESKYADSAGLCLPHFRLLLRQPLSPDTANRIIAVQRRIWQRLHTELQEFQRKSDISHAHEPMGSEGDSWTRAIDAIAGTQGALPDRTRT